jgi:2-dehydro-3-deoxygluconokinase
MIAGWAAEGVGTGRVARLKGKLPGLYMIQTDEFGDRRFFHWRDSAAARSLMDLTETSDILDSLDTYDVIYLSAITLSIYDAQGRTKLFEALRRARKRGARVAFDTNFRARGWPDPGVARAVFDEAFATSDIVLASAEDLLPLYPHETDQQLMARIACGEAALKLLRPGSIVRFDGVSRQVKAEPVTLPVVDTTAAGDSFAAAYIAARLAGAGPVEAAQAGHRLGGVVVGYPGAIIPRSAMPADILPGPVSSHKASR